MAMHCEPFCIYKRHSKHTLYTLVIVSLLLWIKGRLFAALESSCRTLCNFSRPIAENRHATEGAAAAARFVCGIFSTSLHLFIGRTNLLHRTISISLSPPAALSVGLSHMQIDVAWWSLYPLRSLIPFLPSSISSCDRSFYCHPFLRMNREMRTDMRGFRGHAMAYQEPSRIKSTIQNVQITLWGVERKRNSKAMSSLPVVRQSNKGKCEGKERK